MTAYRSFTEALAGQMQLKETVLEQDHPAPLKEAARARLSEKEVQADVQDKVEFNTKLSKLMKRLKKDAGATSITQNYRGTGSQKAVRQLWVRFKNGAVLDIWLNMGNVMFGGVVARHPEHDNTYPDPRQINHADRTPEEVYRLAKDALKKWV